MKRNAQHLIAAAYLRADEPESWVACTCGERVVATSPEAVNEPYQRHRVAVGAARGETAVRHDGVHGQSWRKGGNDIVRTPKVERPPRQRSTLTHAESQRAYRKRHPERVREIERAYRERKRAEAAA